MTEFNHDFIEHFSDIVPMSRGDVLVRLRKELSSYRFDHCCRVETTAKTIASQVGVDPIRAGIAGLLHDYAKERPDEDFKTVIKKYHLDQELLGYGNEIWHGLVGQYLVRSELGITDSAVLEAIAYHTVGAPTMSLLDKVVFVADYVEPGRDFPGVEQARAALATSLDDAVAYELQQTIIHLASRQQKIFPMSVSSYNILGIKKEK